jgi:hypothetical protein
VEAAWAQQQFGRPDCGKRTVCVCGRPIAPRRCLGNCLAWCGHRLRDQTNPRQLRREIYNLLDKLLLMPGATGDTTEDANMTLAMPVKV